MDVNKAEVLLLIRRLKGIIFSLPHTEPEELAKKDMRIVCFLRLASLLTKLCVPFSSGSLSPPELATYRSS